jgi:hypothetical protein
MMENKKRSNQNIVKYEVQVSAIAVLFLLDSEASNEKTSPIRPPDGPMGPSMVSTSATYNPDDFHRATGVSSLSCA